MEVEAIHHVTLIVDDLERAHAFYTEVLGLEALPSFGFDYPTQFYRVNAAQQLHISEWLDQTSFRGHVCLTVRDWDRSFAAAKEQGLIDTAPWGNPRRLPDGTMQMFVRDPSGNLIEITQRGADSPAVLADPLIEQGIYVSGRNDPRGSRAQSGQATLHHDR
jgi:catechol 2,3-dioxygenase-like lactoylglutathione lyase family enzyme